MSDVYFVLWIVVALWMSGSALVRRLRGAEWPGRGGPFLHVWLIPVLWPVLLASSGGVIGLLKVGLLLGGVALGHLIGGHWNRPLDGAWIALWTLLGGRLALLGGGAAWDWWCPARPACVCGSTQFAIQVRHDLPEAARADHGHDHGWPLICRACGARYLHLAAAHRFLRLDKYSVVTPFLAVRRAFGRWESDPAAAPDLPPVPPLPLPPSSVARPVPDGPADRT